MIQVRQSKQPATIIRLNFVLAHGDGLLMPQDWNYGRTPGLCKLWHQGSAPGGFERYGLFYKGECQGKYFSLDRSRKTFPWLPAPLTIEDAGLVLCPSDLGAYVVPSQQMHLLQ
jgi:hypothetical protein